MHLSRTHWIHGLVGTALGAALLLTLGASRPPASAPATAKDSPDFQRDVRPILSRYCFRCHGPDDKSRKAKLRLDLREDAVKPLKSGASAIVPGKPDQSELIKRIFAHDEDELMPPPETKNALSEAQKNVLKRWIAAGAEYTPHWSFEKPKQAPLPVVKQKNWPRNPIDHFVLARLEQEKLKPAPVADNYTLVRRLYFDLIGLPPTPEQTDEFIRAAATNRDRAVESLVDQLLASPHYGERWGRKWLDLARYADSNGYEKDRTRSIWPWRDWVINALNADIPFDQFTIEQLAGDLLPKATLDQRVATGFHRNTMLNEEGGIDPMEFRYYAMVDRVATTGTTWLGLTIQCAQCHTHKFDPIPHREYYQFMAFMDNANEPDLDLPAADSEKTFQTNREKAAKLLADLPEKFPRNTNAQPALTARETAEQKFVAWLDRERARTVTWTPLRPAKATSNLPLLEVQPDNSVFASGDISKSDTYDLEFPGAPGKITAIRLEAMPDARLPAHGPGMCYYEGPKGDFFLGEFQLNADGQPVKFASATESYFKNNFGSNPATAKAAIDGDPQTGWSCAARYGEAHEAVFVPAEPISASRLNLKMLFGRHYACSLGRFRISVTTDAQETAARSLSPELEALLRKPDTQLTDTQRQQLREHFLLTTPELAKEADAIRVLRRLPAPLVTLVLQERPPENPRATFIHNRGEFLQPTERVEPGVITAVAPLRAGVPRNRLTLAKWLVSPENPLTARVTVNRQWAALFGRGIVRTTEDFGLQGEMPTHPELLDWLAVEFMKQGWSLKKLHKLIVLSATYQQSSRTTPELVARDPQNRFLSHGPRSRIEAEMIRDGVLQASGLLVPTLGGPPVFPPQPEGVTEAAYGKPAWNTSTGDSRYRRSLYTFTKRTAPFAMFNTFDAPTGEACVARRDVSNTPLQALTLLNDAMFLEAAQALGGLVARREGSVEDKVGYAFRRVLTRPPAKDELALLVKFYHAQKLRLDAKELDAAKLAGKGEGDPAERAAWAALARALFNLDEMISKG